MQNTTTSDGPEDSSFRPMIGKSGYSWDDNGSLPRSPLGFDALPPMPAKQRGAVASYGVEMGGRAAKPPALFNLPTSRTFSGRPATERGVSLAVSQHRSPYPSSTKFFLTVVPPTDLPHDPPHPRSQASTSSNTHTRRGTLLPLYPTLGGQLYAISREYGLPSIGGLTIYLCDDGEGNLGPRVGDATWSALWSRFFDENAEDLYQDITSPVPPQRIIHGHERDNSGTSSDPRSPYPDQLGIRRESESQEDSFNSGDQRPPSSMRRQAPYGSQPSPMTYNTPSPRATKFGRSQSRSSYHVAQPGGQSRLPIVGKIEWAVDKNRAPWWSQWVGEAEVSSEKSGGSVVTSRSARKGTGRRSMHLTSSLTPNRSVSPIRAPVLTAHGVPSLSLESTEQNQRLNKDGANDADGMEGTLSGSEEQVGPASSGVESNVDMSALGYEPIEEQETHETTHAEEVGLPFKRAFLPAKALAGTSGDDTGEVSESQSYAGYSALMGVDEEGRTNRDETSTRGGAERRASMLTAASSNRRAPSREERSGEGGERQEEQGRRFDPNLLSNVEEGGWRELEEERGEAKGRAGPNRLSARSLSVREEKVASPQMERSASVVHDWFSKTQSPPLVHGYDEGGEEEEQLLPPQDDVGEVVGLWAEKTREREAGVQGQGEFAAAAATPSLSGKSNRSSLGAQSERRTSRQSSQRSNRRSSDEHPVTTSPHANQSPLATSPAVRLADLPEEVQTEHTVSKASLLSPIALDQADGVFGGPSANLGNLLVNRSQLAPSDIPSSHRQDTLDSIHSQTERQPLHSPRLELPRSPGGASHHSSSTEASDTLLDMERALALLSPAVSNNNHQSPAMDSSTLDSTYESGVLTSAVRTRVPYVSSRESMAKAKTLSTSVTPSPRWFRNTTSALSQLPKSASANLGAPRDSTAAGARGWNGEQGSQSDSRVSPRPASAFASTRQGSRLSPWDLQPPVSATRFVENVVEREGEEGEREEETTLIPVPAPASVAQGEQAEAKEGEVSAPGMDLESYDEEGYSTRSSASRVKEHDGEGTKASHSIDLTHRQSGQVYDSPFDEGGGSGDGWLQPVDQSSREAREGDSWIASSRGQTNETPHGGEEGDPASGAHLSPLFSTYSPRSGEYATVGVQAEHDDQTDSVFSLVSDDAPSSASSRRSGSQVGGDEEGAGEGEQADEAGQEAREGATEGAGEETAESQVTPVPATLPRMGHSTHSSDDVQPSIQRMIRGNSFAESSVASSKHTSPYLSQTEEAEEPESQGYDWSNLHINTETQAPRVAMQGGDDGERGDGKGGEERERESTFGDDATTAKEGFTAANSAQSDEGEEWSQSGSEYDDEEEARGSFSTRSRMSVYSGPMGAGLSDAGGRTPTFFYDQHLTDEEPGSRRTSRRASNANKRASRGSTSQRDSRRSVRVSGVHVVDALGVGIYPTPHPVLSSTAEGRRVAEEGGREDVSVDGATGDTASMAGDVVNMTDDQMLSGFEQVPHASDLREASSRATANRWDGRVGSTSSSNSADLQLLSEFTANANRREDPLSLASPARQSPPSLPSPGLASPSAYPSATGSGAPIRRSMGSVRADDRKDSPGKGRRASASATSPSKSVHISSPSPRKFNGPNLRTLSDGRAVPFRTSISPSPRQRFRALPPSPSFLPQTGYKNEVMSPTNATFAFNGGGSEVGLSSPSIRGQAGLATPPSPRGPRPAPSLSDFA